MKSTTKRAFSAPALATAGVIAFLGCSMAPEKTNSGDVNHSGGQGTTPPSSSDTGGAGGIPSSGVGGTRVGVDDPSCSSYTPDAVRMMTPVDPQATSLVSQMSVTDKINVLSGDHVTTADYSTDAPFRSLGVPGLGITNFPMRDGPRGMRALNQGEIATAWAVAEARAASFDLDLEYRVGRAQGLEMRAAKNELALAPVVNTLRHPAWARAQETYGEDPVLLGEMGAAYVRGMQTEGGTAACPKHYVANDTDNNRLTADPTLDEQTLRENYTRPFEIVVKKADPACIMAAYNMVNDTHCTENQHLLDDILRKDWGWGGFVVSDWGAALAGHGAASINAGLDLEMPIPLAFRTLSSDLGSNAVSDETLTQAATRIINARQKFKHFDAEYVASRASFTLSSTPEFVALAKETELKGAVLLKNDGILPLGSQATVVGSGTPNVATIAIVGPDNNLPVAPTLSQNGERNFVSGLGDRGSSQTVPPHAVSYAKGIEDHGGVTVVRSANASAAAGADVVIIPVVMAHEDEGEAYGGGADRVDLTLSGTHPRHWATKPAPFIKSVAAINPNIIVLLNLGSAVMVEDFADSVRAIVQTFYPGQEGGTALASLLFGEVNFSGKLPFTVAQNPSDYPAFQNNVARASIDYYHGYRAFDKYQKPVRYWFGYGQSYTTYAYSELRTLCSEVSENGRLNVEVTVQNTGKVAGEEIVQLYIGYPNSAAPKRPVKELKAFTRVPLAAGESKKVQIGVPVKDTAYWSATGWVVEKGVVHQVLVGPSADPTQLLSAEFTIQ